MHRGLVGKGAEHHLKRLERKTISVPPFLLLSAILHVIDCFTDSLGSQLLVLWDIPEAHSEEFGRGS